MTTYHIIFFILVGTIIFAIDQKREYFPVPIILLLVGVALSYVPFFEQVLLTEKMIMHGFLPALLFISAYQLPLKDLKKYYGTFIALSTIGMLLTAFLLAVLIYTTVGISLSIGFVGALLIASILTPTDPVSTVNILKTSTKRDELADVVEGESLLNDGTSIVLFTVVAGIFSNQKSFHIGSFISEFLWVSIGGVLVGLIFGYILSKVIFWLNHREYQVMVSIVLAYGSFLVAEHIGVSGVLATVTSGLILSYEIDITSQKRRPDYLNGFWENINPIVLSILFIVMGLEATDLLKISDFWAMFVIFILSLLAREAILLIMFKLLPNLHNHFKTKDVHLMTWCGIKGTMSIALLLMFKDQYSGHEDSIISLTIGAIMLSMVIQSLTIYPLSKRN
ncbi:cation:proton antiporter [Piscibacillus halophilus]|uniref:Sodium/proton antiporter, CPA1 family n=1 Tax=Piscibacillus halophilus TaxID=571933 RepID=A0A1H9DMH3_9BACI|nr:sodium:proton antiporter [Piscibacillus halophilus]SEQ14702.1 sodium/proton antiporter, CPA1 family [Piscibacillus halophilus]